MRDCSVEVDFLALSAEYAGSTAKSRLGKAAVEGSKGKFSGYCGAMPRTLNSGKTLFSCRPKTSRWKAERFK